MKPPRALLFASLALATCLAAAQAPPPQEDDLFPSGETMGRAMGVLCTPQAAGARIAAESRRLGQPLDAVLAGLPVPPDLVRGRVIRGMRATIEDAYRFPQLGEFTLFFYRSEVCFREITQLRPYPPIDAVVPDLEKCEADNGKDPREPLLRCVKETVARVLP